MKQESLVGLAQLIGESPAFKRVLQQAIDAAKREGTVLITGEIGTGKELMARAIHRMGNRRRQSFVKLDCSSVVPARLEAELFGAGKSRLEAANHGTLLLKHIEDVSEDLQANVLQAIEKREFHRSGSATKVQIDVRLIATTSDFGLTVQDSGLYKGLSHKRGLSILQIPPLRERQSDIPLLAWHFAKWWAQLMNKSIEAIPPAVMESLINYRWPNNVRELEGVMERAVRSTEGLELVGEFPSSAA